MKILSYNKCFVSLRPNCSSAAWTCSKAHLLYDRIFTFSVFGRIWGRSQNVAANSDSYIRYDTMFSQFRQLFPWQMPYMYYNLIYKIFIYKDLKHRKDVILSFIIRFLLYWLSVWFSRLLKERILMGMKSVRQWSWWPILRNLRFIRF